ncbi:MAG TPA: hypothetical protein PKC18_10590, partial [Lacipirellulaceae bacterium]|nr:hypothetical protein [Lacipirellulaceae bacterium]
MTETADRAAALTGAQIQALNVGRVRLTLLTPQQIAWLTIPQIQSLQLADFKFLTANQTPFLTTGQIASIPDPGPFVEWRASARAALTSVQIQALNVRDVRLGLLTPQQIAWLSVAQIQSLQMPDFKFLGAAQTPSLTVAQIRLIPDPGPFSEWSPEARGALTSAQI